MLTVAWFLFAGVYAWLVLVLPRIAFYFFVFMLAFTPRYFAISIGDSGLAFTLQRFMALGIVVLAASALLTNRPVADRVLSLLATSKFLLLCIVSLFFWKLVATLYSSGLTNILYYLDDLFLSVSVFLAALIFVRTPRDFVVTVTVIVASTFITELLGFIEHYREAPFAKGAEVSVLASPEALEGSFRGDDYRTMVGFTNPLLHAEFLLIAFVSSTIVILTRRSYRKGMAVASLILVAPSMVMTGSRAGIMTLALAVYVYTGLYFWRRFGRAGRFALLVVFVASVVMILDKTGLIFFNPTDYFSGREPGGLSVLVRIQQYFDIGEIIAKQPWLGFGMMQNYETGVMGVTHLDSYWLRLGLESGIPAIVLFALVLMSAAGKSVVMFLQSQDPVSRAIASSFTVLFVVIAVYKLFLSIPSNNAYLFLFLGMLLVCERVTLVESPVRHKETGLATQRGEHA